MTRPKSTYPAWIYDGSDIPDPLGHGGRAVEFLRRLKHPKSPLKGRAFQLDAWQERIIRRIYGPRDAAGLRLIKEVFLLLPRGNRKTSLSAALALLHTIGPESVAGGEAIFAAVDRAQAGIGFDEAKGIVREDPRVAKAVKIYDAFNSAKKIDFPARGSTLRVISSDAAAQHGKTPSFVLADELHVWPNRLLWEAMRTGLDKTDDTLLVVATTAGRGQTNTAWEEIERARAVARGELDDPSLLPILFEAHRDDDFRDEALWHRVNPGLAHGYPSLDGMRRAAARAERSAAERESFRQLKLNVWLDSQTDPFVDMAVYDEGAGAIDVGALKGAPCWIGVDMSTTTDLTAVVAAFRDGERFTVVPHFFCPADNLRARSENDRVPYVAWADDGFLTPTEGNVVDYRAVEACIRDLCRRFDVKEIAFDRAHAMPVMTPLLDARLPVLEMPLDPKSQSAGLATFERAILGGNLRHGGHPVLRWNVDNVQIMTGTTGLRTMSKGKSRERIDGAFAAWMAVHRASLGEDHASPYRKRGIVFV